MSDPRPETLKNSVRKPWRSPGIHFSLFITWKPWRWYCRGSRHGSGNCSSCTPAAEPIQATKWYGYFNKHLQDGHNHHRAVVCRSGSRSHGPNPQLREAWVVAPRLVAVASSRVLPSHHPHPRLPADRMTEWREGQREAAYGVGECKGNSVAERWCKGASDDASRKGQCDGAGPVRLWRWASDD
jgi:hypothetical protein